MSALKAVAKGERLAEKRARQTDSDKITNPKKSADLRRPALYTQGLIVKQRTIGVIVFQTNVAYE